MAYLKNGKELKQQSGNEEECFLYKKKKYKQTNKTNWLHCKMHKGTHLFFFYFFQIPRRCAREWKGDWDWVGEAERVSGLGPASATVTLREWEKERVSESVSAFDWWGRVCGWVTERESVKFKNMLLEIDYQRLGFQVASTWVHVSPCQSTSMARDTNMEIESLIVDFQMAATWQ